MTALTQVLGLEASCARTPGRVSYPCAVQIGLIDVKCVPKTQVARSLSVRSALPTVHTTVNLKTRFSPGAATRSRRGRAARGPGRSIRAIRLEFSGQVSWLVPWLLCTRAVTVHTACTPEAVRLLSASGLPSWVLSCLGLFCCLDASGVNSPSPLVSQACSSSLAV